MWIGSAWEGIRYFIEADSEGWSTMDMSFFLKLACRKKKILKTIFFVIFSLNSSILIQNNLL